MPIYKNSKRKNGLQGYKVRINFTDVYGNRKTINKDVYGLSEAKEMEQHLQEEVLQKEITACQHTVRTLHEEYLKAKQSEVRQTTLDKINEIGRYGYLPTLGDVKLTKLNAPMLQKWKTELAKKGLKTKTMQNYYGYFRTILNYAVRMQYIPKNPLLVVGNFRNPEATSHREYTIYTAEEFKQYIAVAKQYAEEQNTILDWSVYVFLNLAYLTGMRKGEIYALKFSDIDGNIIHVRRSLNTHKAEETAPKNASSYRDVVMPPALVKIVENQRTRLKADKHYTDDYRVCGGYTYLKDSSVNNRNQKFAKMSGLHHIRLHDFRHSHVCYLIENNINIVEISKRIGHSDIEMTFNTYSHLYKKGEEKTIQALEKMF